MLNRTAITLCTALAVVLVSVGVAQAQFSENFESATWEDSFTLVANYGWTNGGLGDGDNPVGPGFTGSNTAQRDGTNRIVHGVNFVGQDLVFFEFDAIIAGGDNWAGLHSGQCCNNQGIQLGGVRRSGDQDYGLNGVDYRALWPETDAVSPNGPNQIHFNNDAAISAPAHYRMEYDRSGPGAEMRFTITEVGNPSNVIDSYTQQVEASEVDNIELLTEFYIQFRPGGDFDFPSQIDNIVIGVPEPSALTLFGLGAVGLLAFSRRAQKR